MGSKHGMGLYRGLRFLMNVAKEAVDNLLIHIIMVHGSYSSAFLPVLVVAITSNIATSADTGCTDQLLHIRRWESNLLCYFRVV